MPLIDSTPKPLRPMLGPPEQLRAFRLEGPVDMGMDAVLQCHLWRWYGRGKNAEIVVDMFSSLERGLDGELEHHIALARRVNRKLVHRVPDGLVKRLLPCFAATGWEEIRPRDRFISRDFWRPASVSVEFNPTEGL